MAETKKKRTPTNKTRKIKAKYIPANLSARDKQKQRNNIIEAREQYKQQKYVSRPKLASFHSKPSKHVAKAMKKFGIASMKPSQELAKKSGCSVRGLEEIVKKGEGAYYSSGSRPNQTAQSWGIARLASALTGGPAAKVDAHILEKYCKKK